MKSVLLASQDLRRRTVMGMATGDGHNPASSLALAVGWVSVQTTQDSWLMMAWSRFTRSHQAQNNVGCDASHSLLMHACTVTERPAPLPCYTRSGLAGLQTGCHTLPQTHIHCSYLGPSRSCKGVETYLPHLG